MLPEDEFYWLKNVDTSSCTAEELDELVERDRKARLQGKWLYYIKKILSAAQVLRRMVILPVSTRSWRYL